MTGAEPEELNNWDEVVRAFSGLEPPRLYRNADGEILQTNWIFRGHQERTFDLKPSIERLAEAKPVPWAALELLALVEFQAKARMYTDVSGLPLQMDQKLNWLALMQHHGIPTRLLDFTGSPYVALYFAVRNQPRCCEFARVWAIDARAVQEVALEKSRAADQAEIEYWRERSTLIPGPGPTAVTEDSLGSLKGRFFPNLIDPASFLTMNNQLRRDWEFWNADLWRALTPDGKRRECFNKWGFVAPASPLVHNPRLSGQQGIFLFNGAEDLSFWNSLRAMMIQRPTHEWCRAFDVPAGVRAELEQHLFQMNIHELSLFPDMEGLSGYIRQKARLHWFPKNTEF
jgi:hypothetical protein